MLNRYFRICRDAMDRAYQRAETEIINALRSGGNCLDCSTTEGYWYP